MSFAGNFVDNKQGLITTTVLKVIEWLLQQTRQNLVQWNLMENGALETTIKNYTFRLFAGEIELPQQTLVELPGGGKGHAVNIRKVVSLTVIENKTVIFSVNNIAHVILEKPLLDLADAATRNAVARIGEKLSKLVSDLKIEIPR